MFADFPQTNVKFGRFPLAMFDRWRVFKCDHVLRLGFKIISLQNWFCKVLAPVVTEPQFFTVLVWLWCSISWKAWQNRCGLRAWCGCEACPWRPMEDGWSQTLGAKVLPDGCGESIWPSDRTMFSWESSPNGSSFARIPWVPCVLPVQQLQFKGPHRIWSSKV